MLSEAWKKSPYSVNGGECVEARLATGGADVRDTQNRDAATLSFAAAEWQALLGVAR